MPQTSGMINPSVAWTKVDVLTSYQRLSGEIQMRVRLRETMNDPEPLFHLRNVSAEPLLPGAVSQRGARRPVQQGAHLRHQDHRIGTSST